MFHSNKKSAQDKNKNLIKFQDSKKDSHARLRALKNILDVLTDHEEQKFFEEYYCEIYYIFYDEFTALELSAKSRGSRLKDDLEELINLFEKILKHLTDKIYSRWQYNSISLVLRKLLNSGNISWVRDQGVRLFMLWLHIMQDRIDEYNLVTYASIIPNFPSPISKIDVQCTRRSVKHLESVVSAYTGSNTANFYQSSIDDDDEWCVDEASSTLCPPQQGDKVLSPDELTKKFLIRILDSMTKQIMELSWHDIEKRGSGFFHVFNHFKRFYLPVIFPLWEPKDYLYSDTGVISVPIYTPPNENAKETTNSTLIFCQCAVFEWLIKFAVILLKKLPSQSMSPTDKEKTLGMEDATNSVDDSVSSPNEEISSPAFVKSFETFFDTANIVRTALYSTRDNVTTVHEVFRQGFLMPITCADIMNHILQVYRQWLFKIKDRPAFMLEVKKDKETLLQLARESMDVENIIRTPSYKEAVASSENIFFSNLPVENVRAGFQANLRLFIAISAQIFFVKSHQDFLHKHVEICRKVMKIYRNVVLEMRLDPLSWEQLLSVLLKVANHILSIHPPHPRSSTLGGQLAGYLLQTLFVTWVRGSMQVYLKNELWDELLRIGKNFNCWDELVKEWAGTMETLTRVMARTVYGIDIQDPPLEKLSIRSKVKKFKRKAQEYGTGEDNRPKSYQTESSSLMPSSSNIGRSASEPGVISSKTSIKKPSHLKSEGTTLSDDSKGMALDGVAGEELFNPQMHLKRTLAEIADSKTDSIDSDTNSVFTHSLSSLTLQEMVKTQHVIPQLTVEDEHVSNQFELGPPIHEPLNDLSDRSIQGLSNSASLHSIASQGSETILDTDYEDHREKNYSKYAEHSESSNINDSSHSTFSNELKQHEPLSPQHSLSSDQDLITFEADIVPRIGRPSAVDAQSIDSHRFVMIENDSFTNGKKNVENNEIMEMHEEEDEGIERGVDDDEEDIEEVVDVEEPPSHVRFLADEVEKEETSTSHGISVIEGGKLEGWTPLSSVVLWRRFIGILGNVNDILDANIHAKVFTHLIEIWQMLEVIKKNQGISLDNKSTPPPPPLTPPLHFCASWCLQLMSSKYDTTHKAGKVLAHKLLCMIVLRGYELKPSNLLMTHFYRMVHSGLMSNEQEIINAIIGQCSGIMAYQFEGLPCLINNFIQGCSSIVSTQYLSYPRKEAITILGSLICFPSVFPDLKIYQSSVRNVDVVFSGKELREKVLIPLLKAARTDPSCRARCVALNSLGLFIVETLFSLGGHQRIYECLSLLLSTLEFHSVVVSSVALDVLWSLSFYYEQLAKFDPILPLKLLEAMCQIALHLHSFSPISGSDINVEELPELLSKLMLCILDWVMVLPKEQALLKCSERESDVTYIGLVLKVFRDCFLEKPQNVSYDKRISLSISQIFSGDGRLYRLACVHDDLAKDDVHGCFNDNDDSTDFYTDNLKKDGEQMLQVTASYGISHIMSHYQHFPFSTGTSQPCTSVIELDDQDLSVTDESTLLDSDRVQFVLLDHSTLLTVIELPQQENFQSAMDLNGLKSVTRFILRDAVGKYCWETSDTFGLDTEKSFTIEGKDLARKGSSLERKHSRNLSITMSRLTSTCPPDVFPGWSSMGKNCDHTDQLLRYIGHSSPECVLYADQPLNVPSPVPESIDIYVQSSIVTSVLKQHNEEENYVHEIAQVPSMSARELASPTYEDPRSPFHVSKLLLHQLGYFSWKNRDHIELLERNTKLLRSVKHLDNLPSRETQKIAIFYVAPGQEDKQSILSNTVGSLKFEQFVSAIGWEVDLSTHAGFMGGLEKNLGTGASAPYFATHSLEIMFHVSTRMPSEGEEQLKKKLKHLGNDEIHVVWSEHSRDFRRGIINTEFGDVLLVIYPIKHNLFRIQIDKKPKIPPFGPLFDGAIIDGSILPTLVRSTVINAGRAKRSTLPLYNRHFEERARSIREISQSRIHKSSFEDFCIRLFAPTFSESILAKLDSEEDGLQRSSSLPSRSNTMTDPSAVLKLLDINNDQQQQGFRSRASSALPPRKQATKKEIYRTHSNSSLNNITEDPTISLFSDSESKESISRRKSLQKKLKKKASTLDFSTEKLNE